MVGNLREPDQSLRIAADHSMWGDVLSGRKTISIRTDHRAYRPGRILIGCHIFGIAVEADVLEEGGVKHCKLHEITQEELEADGFVSHDDMLEQMRSSYYPDLHEDSDVTVLRWENVRGGAVDEFRDSFNG